jgi:hypothetical protein
MPAQQTVNMDSQQLKKAMEAQGGIPPAVGAVGAGFGIGFLLLMLALCLLMIVSMWVIFEKAGEAGWKSLIPIYSAYVLMKVCGKPGWWFILLFIPIVGVVCYFLAMLSLAERFGRGALFGVGLFFLAPIFFPLLAFGGSRS